MSKDKNKQENYIIINAKYLKDLSFENPAAPECYVTQQNPKIDIAVNLNATSIRENVFEVTLQLQAKAILEDNRALFVISVDFAGLFSIQAVNEEQKSELLLVECPTLLFPFASRVISDTVREGNFPPLNINPINFKALYEQKKAAGEVTKTNPKSRSDAANSNE